MNNKITVPEGFDLNVLKHVLIPALDANISDEPNELGSSQISLCGRKTLIKKMYDVPFHLNNKMLFGMIYEACLGIPNVLRTLLTELHERIDFLEPLDTSTSLGETLNKEDKWEFEPGHFIRIHPDIWTNLYSIEVKTTWTYTRKFTKDLMNYQVAQENFYMRFYKHPIGFLHKVNGRVFMNPITKDKESYWETAWLKYGYFLPLYFDENLYDLTMKRFSYLFNKLDEDTFEGVNGPEMSWECNYCSEEVKERCGMPIHKQKLDVGETCSCCGRHVKPKEHCFYRLEEPYCEECEGKMLEVLPP